MFGHPNMTIFSIGHSTRTYPEFLALLTENRIELLVDVRHFPRSQRVPWTTKESLARELAASGIGYEHIEAIGGYRKARDDSSNTGWWNAGFRGYADYMATPEFRAGLDRLIALANDRTTAMMCAEAVPWKCHRSLLSDALLVRGVRVVHILGPGKIQEHRLTTFAKIHDGRLTYPEPTRKGV